MRITVDWKSTELSTKRFWNQERWSGSAGRATGNKEDARNLNSYLETLSAKVYQAKKKLVETDKEITAETLKKVLLGTDEAKRMVLEIFNYHNQQVAALVGGEYAPGTIQRFQTTLDHTRSFIQWKYGVIDLEIKDLDFEFISEFSFWFKSVRKCSHNTTVKYLATFKKIVIGCVKKGWLLRETLLRDLSLQKKKFTRNRLLMKSFNY